MICMHIRDINGKRDVLKFKNREELLTYNWDSFDNENHQILLVTLGIMCLYNALSNGPITIEDVIGFFA